MTTAIVPSHAAGTLPAPRSKSHAQRCIAAALLASGRSTLRHVPAARDVEAALGIARALGATLQRTADTVVITPPERITGDRLDCGESALAMRMFAPIAALGGLPVTLTGGGSLRNRPMSMVARSLAPFGVRVVSDNGHAPLKLAGRLVAADAVLDGAVTSQSLSGLLMALPRCDGDSRIVVTRPVSLPYLRMTIDVMRDFGVNIHGNDDGTEYRIPGGQIYSGTDPAIEGDWSGAAFALVAGALGGPVTVTGLPPEHRPDGIIPGLLRTMGAKVHHSGDGITVVRGDLRAFEADLRHHPDLLPPLAALALHCTGTSRITGIDRVRHKESDRIAALIQGFSALGADMTYRDDCLCITGGPLRSGRVSCAADHRIAMALAIGALGAGGPVAIDDTRCVAKSYPAFFDDLHRLGVTLAQE